jgi:hypothetical protein
VFWFHLQLSSEIFLILRIILRDSHKCTLVFLVKYPLFLSDFNYTSDFSDRFSEKKKSWITKCHQNPSRRSRVVPCGRTDRTKVTIAFRNSANAPNKTGSRWASKFYVGDGGGGGGSNSSHVMVPIHSCVRPSVPTEQRDSHLECSSKPATTLASRGNKRANISETSGSAGVS